MHKGKWGRLLWRLSKAGAYGRQVWKQVQKILPRTIGHDSSTSRQSKNEAFEEAQPKNLLLRNWMFWDIYILYNYRMKHLTFWQLKRLCEHNSTSFWQSWTMEDVQSYWTWLLLMTNDKWQMTYDIASQ